MSPRLQILIIIAIVIQTMSCNAFLKLTYGFNKNFKFKTKQSYLSFLQNKKGIDVTEVIYPDSNSRTFFLESIINDSLSIYYGSLVNDSVELVKKNDLKENLSCMGRILSEIETNTILLNINDSSLFIKSNFKNYKFNFLSNDVDANINDSNKKLKIIMLYGYALGKYFDRTFDEIKKFHENHKESTALYFVTLDDICQLR